MPPQENVRGTQANVRISNTKEDEAKGPKSQRKMSRSQMYVCMYVCMCVCIGLCQLEFDVGHKYEETLLTGTLLQGVVTVLYKKAQSQPGSQAVKANFHRAL